MQNVLLFLSLLVQATILWQLKRLNKQLNTLDFTKENAQLKAATEKAQDELNKISPHEH
jgi:hypothetical protein